MLSVLLEGGLLPRLRDLPLPALRGTQSEQPLLVAFEPPLSVLQPRPKVWWKDRILRITQFIIAE